MGKFIINDPEKKNVDEVIILADSSTPVQPAFTPKKRRFERRSESDIESSSVASAVDTTSINTLIGKKRKRGLATILQKVFIGAIFVIAAIALPCIVFFTMYSGETLVFPYGSCDLKSEYRIPCLMGVEKLNLRTCESVNCCWNDTTGECYHAIPARYTYLVPDSSRESKSANLRETLNTAMNLTARLDKTPFKTDSYPKIELMNIFVDPTHLQILLSNEHLSPFPGGLLENDTSFSIIKFKDTFDLQVNRSDSDDMMIRTVYGPLIASENYWEISIQCPDDGSVHGLGGVTPSNYTLMYNTQFRTASLPFFMCVNKDGLSHGVFVNQRGPMEIAFLNVTNIVVFRSISKTGWDIHLFSGPEPKDVMNQFTNMVGKPKLPPYWSLGLHVCRDFTTNSTNSTHLNVTEIAEELKYFQTSAKSMNLLYESDCIHDKLLNSLNFTISKQIIESLAGVFANMLSDQKKFLLPLPPQVLPTDDDIFIKDSYYKNVYIGSYLDRQVSYPDFSNTNTTSWLVDGLGMLDSTSPVLSGYYLIDNWPLDDTDRHNHSEILPYIPLAMNGSLSNNTVWWMAEHGGSGKYHYETHNYYGALQAERVREASRKITNPLIFSASCYPSVSISGCSHQNVAKATASWSSLKEALISVLAQGLSGVPLASGGPICGSSGNYTEELCLRWYMMGIAFPVMRVSSGYPLRDPSNLGSGYMRTSVTDALRLRYSLLPYLYTLLQDAHSYGTPLARPMFFEFPGDPGTWKLEEQYMLGSSILVAPALYENTASVEVYLPDENITWYHLNGGHPVNNGTGNLTVTVPCIEAELNMLIRSGHIVPMQEPGTDAVSSKKGYYKLIIALNCNDSNKDSCQAEGIMKLEENVSVLLEANSTSLTLNNLIQACDEVALPPLSEFYVYGLKVFVPPTLPPTTTSTYEETTDDSTFETVSDVTGTDEIETETTYSDTEEDQYTHSTDDTTDDDTSEDLVKVSAVEKSTTYRTVKVTAMSYKLCTNSDSITIPFPD